MSKPNYHFEVHPGIGVQGASKHVLVAVSDDPELPLINGIGYKITAYYAQVDWAYAEADRRNKELGYVHQERGEDAPPIRNTMTEPAALTFEVHPVLEVQPPVDRGGEQLNKFVVVAVRKEQPPYQDIGHKIVSWHNSKGTAIAEAEKAAERERLAKKGTPA